LDVSISYCPKGPLLDWDDVPVREKILETLEAYSRIKKTIFLKIDPNIPIDPEISDVLPDYFPTRGWRASAEQIQFRNTLLVDLSPSEEELLANMKQKTRYNIRLAGRKGVAVRTAGPADLDLLYTMYAETALRDGFAIRHREYYQDAWGAFIQEGLAQPFIAEVEGDPVAAAILFHFADTALYMYGMSRSIHRKLMPTYLIQWEMIRWAKQHGCQTYDFWGAPDSLEKSDPMWGVYRFKSGFNPAPLYTPGAIDYPVRPLLYQVYTRVLPGIMAVWRKLGRRATSSDLSNSLEN
jgi:lipid II:glycine glycyltransferase (peptidoglycan interpeptide bridge formation enzyme)